MSKLDELQRLATLAAELLPITVHDGRDYAEAYGTDFQAMTVYPERFKALNDFLPSAPALLACARAAKRVLEAKSDYDAYVKGGVMGAAVLDPAEIRKRGGEAFADLAQALDALGAGE